MFDCFSFEPPLEKYATSFFGTNELLMAEVEQARREYQQGLTTNYLECNTRSPITDIVRFVVERKRSLFDLFHVVEKGKYQLLWNESVKLRMILATTV